MAKKVTEKTKTIEEALCPIFIKVVVESLENETLVVN
tara:strand:- start:107 stop:217 length:111 start_codon:yes stop_codon:yes gene_type:complete